jgi:beta-xylosidase
MAVLKSSDMVNWRLIGHLVPDLTVLGGPILNTESSSGFGLDAARYFTGRGWDVVATMYSPKCCAPEMKETRSAWGPAVGTRSRS